MIRITTCSRSLLLFLCRYKSDCGTENGCETPNSHEAAHRLTPIHNTDTQAHTHPHAQAHSQGRHWQLLPPAYLQPPAQAPPAQHTDKHQQPMARVDCAGSRVSWLPGTTQCLGPWSTSTFSQASAMTSVGFIHHLLLPMLPRPGLYPPVVLRRPALKLQCLGPWPNPNFLLPWRRLLSVPATLLLFDQLQLGFPIHVALPTSLMAPSMWCSRPTPQPRSSWFHQPQPVWHFPPVLPRDTHQGPLPV